MHDAARPDHLAGLVTPAAVRLVDLDGPLADLELPSKHRRIGYRSLLAVARIDGELVGAVAVPVGTRGRVPGDWLAEVLRCELGSQLHGASTRESETCSRRRGSRARRPSVSVVVTGSRDPIGLERCLRSILACDDPDFEVIVVESRPASHAMARMLEERFGGERRLRLVESRGAGVSRARNAGLADAAGEVVMFADGDVVVDARWISRCRAAFDSDRDVACVTGLILSPQLENDGQLLCERFASVAKGLHRRALRLPDRRTTHPFFYYMPGSMGSGANTALRADVARELGGFDAALGPGTPSLGGEDLDLYGRLLQARHTVAYDPSVIVWQEHDDGVAQFRRDVLRQGVSVGAALAKQLVTSSDRRALLRALPAGVRYELDLGAAPGAAERPRGLDWRRRLGLALGLPAYAASALRRAYAGRAGSRAARTTATRADRVLFATVAALCLVAPLLVAVGAPSGLRFPGVLALLCLAPGTVLVAALGRRGASAEPGLVIGASLGVAAVLAQTMLWLGTWWPNVFLYLLALTCLVPLLARCQELVPRRPARASDDVGDAPHDERREASEPWVTVVELAGRLSDLRPVDNPSGARNGRVRVLARLHGQPIGCVELPLRQGTVAADALVAAINAELSTVLAAHLARDGLRPARLTPEGFPSLESPPCAAGGFYGEREPFVSVILSASNGHGAGPLEPSLQAVLAVDYPAYEVVVARVGCTDDGSRSGKFRHPRVRYVYEPSPDPWQARRRAVRAADGDILAFTDSEVIVDANWVRAIVTGLAPAGRVGCVTGPILARHGAAPETGVNFAVSRDVLLAVGGFDAMRTSEPTDRGADNPLIPCVLDAGWAVSHHPHAKAWGLLARHHGAAGVLAPVANRLARAASAPKLRRWLRAGRDAATGVSLPRPATLHASVIATAGLAWWLSVRGTDLSRMAGLGLLDAMPASYFLAVGLLLAGFVANLTRRELSNPLLWLYALALILVLHGTTALLYDEPRYSWTYKHLGVIALIAHTGAVDRSVDIYNSWPGFFALNAWLSSVTGVGAISYAAWAQVFFNVVNVLAVRFALRGLTRDERLLWTACLFFVLGNWVGQDYLSPQAFGFVLTLVVLGLCLRCGPASTRPHSCRASWLASRLEQLRVLSARTPDDDLPPPPLGSGMALIVGGLCYLAVVTSHQLSPVMLILSVAAISLVARRVPVWIPVAMLAIEVWWVGLAWAFVKDHFSLIDPGSPGAAPVGRDLHSALPGAVLGIYAPAAVVALIAILALCGAARRLRAGKRDLVPVCLILAPLFGIGLQSYGGEGGNRAYLFALPWLAFFAAAACVRPPLRSHVVRMRLGSVAVATAAVSVCLLFAYFGQELAHRIAPDDVRAAAWYEQHAPPGSIRIVVAPNTPDRLTARYPLVSLNTRPALVQLPAFRGHLLGAADVPRLERVIAPLRPNPTFLLLSQGQEDYARLNGLLPSGSISRLARALDATAAFRLVYRRPTAWIFEYASRRPH